MKRMSKTINWKKLKALMKHSPHGTKGSLGFIETVHARMSGALFLNVNTIHYMIRERKI